MHQGPPVHHHYPSDLSHWQLHPRSSFRRSVSPLEQHHFSTFYFYTLMALDICYILGISFHDQTLFLLGRRVEGSAVIRARGLAPPFRPSAPCPRHLHTPNLVLLCATPIHVADCIYLPLGCPWVKESFPWASESAGPKCHVWNAGPLVPACVACSPMGWAASF